MEKNNTLIKLKEKERELRQGLIIEAAREVFGQKTYDKVSMAEIAKAAGISKSSIYTYFNSQEELYAQIAYQDACEFIKELNRRISAAGPNPVRATIDYFLDFYIENASPMAHGHPFCPPWKQGDGAPLNNSTKPAGNSWMLLKGCSSMPAAPQTPESWHTPFFHAFQEF